MNIGVIGCGYVGLVTAACFAEIGHTVSATDSDSAKLAVLRQGLSPIHEHHLPQLLLRHTGKRLQFTDSIEKTIRHSQVVFICVGTPPARNGDVDLSCVHAAVDQISRCARSHLLIVEKSTVPVHTCESIRRTMLYRGIPPDSFTVASNPEFLREGSAVHDFLYPDRIVIGSDDERSRRALEQVYLPLVSGDYYRKFGRIPGASNHRVRLVETAASSAELIKHACNAFLAMKISFINAVAHIAEAVGADISEIQAGLGSDPRIGAMFLGAGIGYGGACFPKDLLAFRALADEAGCRFDLLSEVMRINSAQRLGFLEKVRTLLWPLEGKRIAVLGLAFKGGTDDIRESPAVEIVRQLIHEGAGIAAFDPAAMDRARNEFPLGSLEFAIGPYEAIADADALLILTDWPEFGALDLNRVRRLLRSPLVFDGRNLYSPGEMRTVGLSYISVGRAPVFADSNTARPITAPAPEGIEDSAHTALFNLASWRGRLRIEGPGARVLGKSSKWTEF